MRTIRFFLIASFICTISNINAQIKVESNGDVMIGTGTPTEKLQVDGNIRIKSGGYIDDDATTGGNADDWIKLGGYIELKSYTDSYGIVLRDKDNSNFFGLTQIDGYSYLASNNTSGNYFLRGNSSGDAFVRRRLYVGGTDAYFYRDLANRIATPDNFYVQASSSGTYLYSTSTYLGNSSGDNIYLRNNSFSWTSGGGGIINTSGNVGIGTTSPSVKLDVEGAIWATGTITSSDERMKENITDISASLSTLKQLRPVKYNLKKTEKTTPAIVLNKMDSAMVFDLDVEAGKDLLISVVLKFPRHQ